MRTTSPMYSIPLLESGRDWLRSSRLSEPLPETVAVGWSGGADSTALLLALAGMGYRVHAWHVDHGWHGDSAGQAEALRGWAEARGIEFSGVRLPAPAGHNREAEARHGRYRAFETLASEHGITTLCLAHHRDDQAETVCMRMLQGAGAKGISGMRAVVQYGSLTVYRPLLHVPGLELRRALASAGVPWIEDASNRDLSLWRNHLRHRYFPALKSAGIDPTELYMRWQRMAEMTVSRLEGGLNGVKMDADRDGCSMEWHQWQRMPPELRAMQLQRMMRRLFGPACVAGKRHIELVEAWMANGGNGGVDLSRSRLMRRDDRLLLARKLPE